MTRELPDVASNETSQIRAPLEWVGMSEIDLPIQIFEPDCAGPMHAIVDAQVNLPSVEVKGIHMSRLYRMLDEVSRKENLTPKDFESLVRRMVESHRDCGSDSGRVSLRFDLLARRSALRTVDLAGWKAYPVQIEAKLEQKTVSFRATVQVEYSSTCPCSAALSRQLVADGFREQFQGSASLTNEDVATWLEQNATIATPHSQRSEATVSVDISGSATEFGLMGLIARVEKALATPVQTAVKRADEQAFAWLNGQNLMYVEDAARRIQSELYNLYDNLETQVRHLESLHPHDAVATASGDVQ